MFRKIVALVSSMAAIGIASASATPVKTPQIYTDHIGARLLLDRYSIDQNADIQGMLELNLDDGWHAYWRNPGDVGLPVSMVWADNSRNIADVQMQWPAPKRFEIADMQNFGYDGSIHFPLAIKVKDVSQDAQLHLNMSVMICKDICIPQTFELYKTLYGQGDARQTGQFAQIQNAKRHIPALGDNANLKLETIVIGKKAIVLSVYSKRGYDHADMFLELDGHTITSRPEIDVDAKDSRKALIIIKIPEDIENLPADLAGTKIKVTFVVRGKAIEKEFQL